MRRKLHNALLVSALIGSACKADDARDWNASAASGLPESSPASAEDPVRPLPTHLDLDARKVALGAKLFADPILSKDKNTTCLDCHVFEKGGADGLAHSQLAGRLPTAVNTPSLFNLAFDYRFNWNGKFETLPEQLDGPMKNPRAMDLSIPDAVERLRASSDYVGRFSAIYRDGVTEAAFRDVMAEYERSLFTPNARFDRYLRGERDALDAREIAGYELFKSHGCISCHQGINLGGNMMQRFGVMKDYFRDRTDLSDADQGRFSVTGREEDRFFFRVPSLRNVALTAPYFHDGSAATLDKAVRVMAEYQLGRPLDDEQADRLVAFLGTLTGDLPEEPR